MPTRKDYLKRKEQLWNELGTWLTHWKEISEQFAPRRFRWAGNTGEQNRSRRNDKIINSTPRRALRNLQAGLFSTSTNPTRPWFRLTTSDPDLAEYGPVREWLYLVEERLRWLLLRSNQYNVLYSLFGDLVTFGTAPAFIDDDDETFVRAYLLTPGTYALAASPRGTIDTVYRSIQMTVEQVVRMFGYHACTERTRRNYDQGNYDVWIEILHVVEPNRERDPSRAGPAGMAYRSVWMEVDAPEDAGFLRVSGYEEFPVVCPRWDVIGTDVYGISPAMDALGDCRQLQHLEKLLAQVAQILRFPPMVGPRTHAGRRISLLPGDFTPTDIVASGDGVRPAIPILPQAVAELRDAIERVEQRVANTLYADLWVTLTDAEKEMTATEILERNQERALQLGPVVLRQQNELHDPLIERNFAIAHRRGLIPPAPPELQGQELKVEYISALAQAMRMIGVANVERYANTVISVAQAKPEMLDKFDGDQFVDVLAEILGVPPNLVVPDDRVVSIREQRAQLQQAQVSREAMLALAKGVRDMAGARLGDDNMLRRVMEAFGDIPSAVE